jgi:glyoxylase-like metal-dependent hydrolase (beta-lactamase superfamily II)
VLLGEGDLAQWQVGEARITAIVEQPLEGLEGLITKAKSEALAEIDWLKPHYLDENGQMIGLIQCFVVEIGGRLAVVDTCVGDEKDLAFDPAMDRKLFGLLDRFNDAGFDPSAIDLVLCTHLHFDHVGLNTRLVGSDWVPTFPNARYLFARTEYDHWAAVADSSPADPASLTRPFEIMREAFTASQRCVFAQSVKPVVDAGLAELVDPPCEPMPGIVLVPTPGHTPGHVSIVIGSGEAKALITGDSFHHPCQIAHAEWATVADSDRDVSTQTRLSILDQLAGTDVLMLGTHFAEPSGGRIVADGDSYRLEA